jgi:C4-dicarboxylate transporter DctM subunit
MNRWAKVNRGFDRVVDWTGQLGVFLTLMICLFVVLVILARHVSGLNIGGLFDVTVYGLVIFPFLTMAYALKKEKHIIIDFLLDRFPKDVLAVFNVINYFLSLIFMAVIVWKTTQWTWMLFAQGIKTSAVFAIPKGLLTSTIVFGSLLMIPLIIRIMAANVRTLIDSDGSLSRSRPGVFWPCVVVYVLCILSGLLSYLYVTPVVGLLILLIALLFSGMPMFLALGFIAVTTITIEFGTGGLMQAPLTILNAMSSFDLTCLPLFILGGLIMEQGQIAGNLFKFFQMLAGRSPSAMLLATVCVGGVFCAISGSSVGTTAVVAAVTVPALTLAGYNRALSCGTVAGATIGTVIPPSISYVVYGVLTNTSIAQLFMAGIIPGAIIFGMYFIYIIGRSLISKRSLYEGGVIPSESQKQLSRPEKVAITKNGFWGLLAPVVVLGGIYEGWFTPTEGAAVLIVYAIVVCAFIMKTFRLRDTLRVGMKGAETSTSIFCIIISAFILAMLVSQLQISNALVDWAVSIKMSADGLLWVLFILLLVLGCFMESASLKALTLPVFFPVCTALEVNPLFLGVFYTIMGEIALLTPPVGLNLFVIQKLGGVPLAEVTKGCIPFNLIMMIALFICWAFPATVTWLPSTMMVVK